MSVAKITAGYHSVSPYLIVPNAEEAIEFYQQAFAASEHMRLNMPDGSIGHAEIRIGNSIIMLSNANQDMGFKSPEQYGGSPASIFLYVEDIDRVFKRAIACGAKATQPSQNMFWGDRLAKLEDPFGYTWSIATHVEDVTLEESQQRLYQEYSRS